MPERVILGLGSNRSFENGNGELNSIQILKNAIDELQSIFLPQSFVWSSVYQTKAMYYENQQDFYNMVVSGLYEGQPRQLLEQINKIEAKYGRDRSLEFRNGPRSLDIDIELFGNFIINEPDLEIPHIKLQERQFVLKPMLEIFPELTEPLNGALYKDFLLKLPDQGVNFFCTIP